MTEKEVEALLRKEVGEAKTAQEVDLAVTAYLQRLALAGERREPKGQGR
jgi:hypothetical protein